MEAKNESGSGTLKLYPNYLAGEVPPSDFNFLNLGRLPIQH